jgi:S-phase kinase-associated protein 1
MNADDTKVILLAGSVSTTMGTTTQAGPSSSSSSSASSEASKCRVEITRKAACLSELIKSMLQDDDDPNEVPEIPLLEVSKDILDKVVLFLNKHRDDPMKDIPKPIHTSDLSELVSEWDVQYIDLEQEQLFKVILAANYLDIPPLLDLGITKFCCMIKDKGVDEIKEMLNIEKDITPEEERLVREKNDWIFDVHKPNETETGL